MSILHYQGFLGCLTAMTPRSVSDSWHFLAVSRAGAVAAMVEVRWWQRARRRAAGAVTAR
ncbi:MAG TPA: hypothetical protein VFW64_14370 [Pseudonocardiaceae bacterium]|nr:hypothetical protein [Pseudonocardiaceae bacterium]